MYLIFFINKNVQIKEELNITSEVIDNEMENDPKLLNSLGLYKSLIINLECTQLYLIVV